MNDTTQTTEREAQAYYDAVFDAELVKLLDQADSGDEEAREFLKVLAYGIEKRTTYYVTLAGGGPAARLMVEVGEYGEVEAAQFQYQNWFTPWTPAPQQDTRLVERLASVVGCYEG